MNETPRPGGFAARSEPSKAASVSGRRARVGVLLINLGTPDGTSYWPMRRYLKEFLSDRRVIETNRVLWWFILNFIVLVKRPFSERGEVPLDLERRTRRVPASHHHAESGGESRASPAPERESRSTGPCVTAIRASPPASRRSMAEGCDRLLVLPALSAICRGDDGDRQRQSVRCAEDAPGCSPRFAPCRLTRDDPVYIAALADSIRDASSALDFEPEAILASFHGMPQDYIDKGDPYQQQCVETDRGAPRRARAARREAQAHLPVALRPRRMAQALHRQDGGGVSRGRA